MGFLELFILSVGLSMDAFAVAICKGLSMKNGLWKSAVIIGLYFGGFQALMPLVGYFLGSQFADKIQSVDHWIAFVLLLIIGGRMIYESVAKKDENEYTGPDSSVSFKVMLPLAVATSIDALAVGVSFAFLQVNIWFAILTIGVTTFFFSFFGTKIGNVFGLKYKNKAELAGGIILVLIGIKILVEHLLVL